VGIAASPRRIVCAEPEDRSNRRGTYLESFCTFKTGHGSNDLGRQICGSCLKPGLFDLGLQEKSGHAQFGNAPSDSRRSLDGVLARDNAFKACHWILERSG